MRSALLLAAALAGVAVGQLNGTYTINPSQPPSPTNFDSIAAATTALSGSGVSGPVTFEMYDDAGPYTESTSFNTNNVSWAPSTAVMVFTQWTGSSAANRVTFKAAAGEQPELDATGRAMGIFWGGADYVTVQGLEIHHPTFDAISLYSESGHGQPFDPEIRECVIHDIPSSGVVIYGNSSQPVNTLIVNNIFYRCQTASSGGFSTLARFGYISSRRSQGTRVLHNTFYGDAFGPGSMICFLGSVMSSGTPWAEVANNVFVRTTPSAALMYWSAGLASIPAVSDGNVWWDPANGTFANVGGALSADLAAWQAQTGRDANSTEADPLMVDPGGVARDFHLTPASPAVDFGVATGVSVPTDFEGDLRDASPDSGVDELVWVRIVSTDTVPTQVAPGGTGIAVSMTVENIHPSQDATVSTADLVFTGLADRTAEYTVVPDPGNPTSVLSQGTATFDFTVDVSVAATEETITITGDVTGTLTGGNAFHATGAQTADTWDVVGARPEVRTVDAVPTVVGQGSTGNVVNFTVENVGLTDWTAGAFSLSFMGMADRTSEYTVTPAPGNPVGVAVGATETFSALVDVSPAATIETITIDVAQIDGTDAVTGLPQGDSGADTTDTWDVVTCAASLCGDCNMDGAVNILDALLGAQHSALLVTLTGVQFTNCNVIGDLEPAPTAVVDILDALTIAQVAAQLPVSLNCC